MTTTRMLKRWCLLLVLIISATAIAACGTTNMPQNNQQDTSGLQAGPDAENNTPGADDTDAIAAVPGDETNGQPDATGTTTADATSTTGVDTAPGAPDTTTPAPIKVGRNDHTLTLEGPPRAFIVYVSEKAKASGNAPVVFMFHGSGQTGQHFYEGSRWREIADLEGLIVVFPQALVYCYYQDDNKDGDFDDKGERSVGTKWAQGALGDPERMPLCSKAVLDTLTPDNRKAANHPLNDDVAFVKAMVDFLKGSYPIDAKRIYASGFSNGSAFVSRLTLEMSETFAATHGQAGLLKLTPVPTSRPISMILSIGAKDDRFTTPYGVQSFPLDESLLTIPGFRIRTVDAYLAMLQLTDDYTFEQKTIDGRTVASFSYTTSTIGASNSYQFLMIEGLYHVYPPFAPALLWQFFSQHKLP